MDHTSYITIGAFDIEEFNGRIKHYNEQGYQVQFYTTCFTGQGIYHSAIMYNPPIQVRAT